MSNIEFTAIAMPDIRNDGKAIRVALQDAKGNIQTLIIPTANVLTMVYVLERAITAAIVAQGLNPNADGKTFKPTPKSYQVRGIDLVPLPEQDVTILALQTTESTELHLVFEPHQLALLFDKARQNEEAQDALDSDAVN